MKLFFKRIMLLSLVTVSLTVQSQQSAKTIANLKPTVILISIDGFRNDYLDKFPLPNLKTLIKSGVHSALLSVFPSVTFPNHYSIVTGLYPEHHGIVLNEFLASDINEPFTHHGHAPAVTDPRWWKGEPIWVTAEKQGQLTASAFWPSSASTIDNTKPNYFRDFAEDGNPQIRVQQILDWLDLPIVKRPTLLMAYFENVDNAGHLAGPDSMAVRKAAIQVDDALGSLIAGLKARGIESKVNIIVLSDHGMSKVDPGKIIDLMKFISPADLKTITDTGAIVGVYPKPRRLDAVYHALKHANAPMKVYRASDIPAGFHYRSAHTPPIICVADEQGFILGRDRKAQHGTHGYDPSLKSMQGIFIASGPAFKKGYTREPFKNINIYALLTEILRLKAAPNDGAVEATKDILNDK